jgi:succinoglycan biosynthesis protein ExoL
MLHILYLAHDLADPAIRRRLLTLQAGGADVTLAGFRRGADAKVALEGLQPIELGVTEDAQFLQRAGAVAKACLTLSARLKSVRKPDVIIARNLEMLAVASRANALFGGSVPIAYECLDIHRFLLRRDMVGKAMRMAEARFGRDVGLLITSSPAFVENYFKPLSSLKAPVLFIENKVLDLEGNLAGAPIPRPPQDREPWKIGWFGALRCRKSLDILSVFSRAMEGRVEIVLRGRPAYSEFRDFDATVAREPYITFGGAYRNPEDLPSIYDEVQFSWAIDFFEEGLNSQWLLPNRLYESGRHGAVPIALDGTETARFLKARGIGIVLPDTNVTTLRDTFQAMSEPGYLDAFRRLAGLDQRQWIIDRADCRLLVQRLAAVYAAPPAVPSPQTTTSQNPRVNLHD